MSDHATCRAAADRPFVDVGPEPAATRCSKDEAENWAALISVRHGVSVAEIKGRRRLPHIVEARRDLYQTLRALGWDYPRIGAFVGGRHHTTVMAALGAAHKERRRPRD